MCVEYRWNSTSFVSVQEFHRNVRKHNGESIMIHTHLGGEVDVAIESSITNGILVVRMHGELDHHAVETIRNDIEQALADTHYRGLVLSFRGIDFMDSSGLGLILGRYRTVAQRNARMALCEVTPSLRKIFELSGILKIVPVYDIEQTAVVAVKEA
jgi:stage II sporulation protein AA (anti-sigma F factor antagonist)